MELVFLGYFWIGTFFGSSTHKLNKLAYLASGGQTDENMVANLFRKPPPLVCPPRWEEDASRVHFFDPDHLSVPLSAMKEGEY